MSSFEELRKRVESAEQQFAAMSRQRRDYGQRLIDMIAMHERNLADSGGRMATLRQAAEEAQALAQQRERELNKARGENEQLRHMLHSLLTAIERGRSNEFEETMLELDHRISAMVAANSDDGLQQADEISQAPETWTHQAQTEEFGTADLGWPSGDSRPGPFDRSPDPGARDEDQAAEGEAMSEAADAPPGRDMAGPGDIGRPPTLEEVLERAGASGQSEGSALEDPEAGDETLSPEDLASLTRMLDESVAAAEADGEADREQHAPSEPDPDADIRHASIAEIADRLRAEHAADAPPADTRPADLGYPDEELELLAFDELDAQERGEETPEAEARPIPARDQGGAAGPDADQDEGEEEEDGDFVLLDEAEMEKSLSRMSDRLFSDDDYAEEGFGQVAAAEAVREPDDPEADDEMAFDLSDLDLGGEIDGPPEAGAAAKEAGEEAGADSTPGTGSDVDAEEEAELERWRAEVLGRIAAEAGEAAAAGASDKPGRGDDQAQRAARHRSSEDDDALAELDAILAEEDRSFATDSDVAPVDPEGHRGGSKNISADPRARRGLAPAVRDSLDAATRAEILARVRQSHSSGRGGQED